jgi:hypothetical protein
MKMTIENTSRFPPHLRIGDININPRIYFTTTRTTDKNVPFGAMEAGELTT